MQERDITHNSITWRSSSTRPNSHHRLFLDTTTKEVKSAFSRFGAHGVVRAMENPPPESLLLALHSLLLACRVHFWPFIVGSGAHCWPSILGLGLESPLQALQVCCWRGEFTCGPPFFVGVGSPFLALHSLLLAMRVHSWPYGLCWLGELTPGPPFFVVGVGSPCLALHSLLLVCRAHSSPFILFLLRESSPSAKSLLLKSSHLTLQVY